MRRLSLIVVGAAALACGQPPATTDPSQEVVKEEPAVHNIAVQLEQRGDRCVGTHPVKGDKQKNVVGDDDFKLHVTRGGLVRWTFKNDCSEKMSVGIADFRVPERYSDERPGGPDERIENDRYPLTESCPDGSRVEVGSRESKVLECHIKNDIKQEKITWKYDIVRYEGKEKPKTIIDPELEIPRR